MDIHIRLATDTDIPQITAIYNQSISLGNATAHTSPVTSGERRDWLAEHNPGTDPVFVAWHDDVVIGYCSISAYRRGREALRHTKEISYFVHENYRRQGVASALLRYTLDRCPALQISNLFAILLDNNPASVALLEKFDFEQWGHMPDVADFSGNKVGHLYYGLRVLQAE